MCKAPLILQSTLHLPSCREVTSGTIVVIKQNQEFVIRLYLNNHQSAFHTVARANRSPQHCSIENASGSWNNWILTMEGSWGVAIRPLRFFRLHFSPALLSDKMSSAWGQRLLLLSRTSSPSQGLLYHVQQRSVFCFLFFILNDALTDTCAQGRVKWSPAHWRKQIGLICSGLLCSGSAGGRKGGRNKKSILSVLESLRQGWWESLCLMALATKPEDLSLITRTYIIGERQLFLECLLTSMGYAHINTYTYK